MDNIKRSGGTVTKGYGPTMGIIGEQTVVGQKKGDRKQEAGVIVEIEDR